MKWGPELGSTCLYPGDLCSLLQGRISRVLVLLMGQLCAPAWTLVSVISTSCLPGQEAASERQQPFWPEPPGKKQTVVLEARAADRLLAQAVQRQTSPVSQSVSAPSTAEQLDT